ncbi:MAG: hypothetical protein OEW45_22095 [Deltaproteobacteria bacterium]|nr:hypothetical protein [Deltaproteobacteria bacterium]
MASRYAVLNVLLFFIILLLIFKNDEIWTPPKLAYKKEGGKKVEAQAAPLPALAVTQEPPLRESFTVIAEKNIFHPDRKEFSLLTVESAKLKVRPPLQLYGVMIANDVQTASIANPTKPLPKGERETKTIKIGDQVGDYKLTQILPDRIVLEAPGDTYEVLLYDPKSPKKRAAVKAPPRPAEKTGTLRVSPPSPLPKSPSAAPQPIPIPILPRPMVTSSEPKVESTTPMPVNPAPIPDPNILRGRRSLRPGLPPGDGGN